jgi:protoporphyrinogen/coproporphyrinogen III oxidase
MTTGIIGAGISGLTAAYTLQQQGLPYHLWEATDRVGGYIQSVREQTPTGTYLRELGPNSLLGDDNLLNWLDSIGLASPIVFANEVSKARYIHRRGAYRQLPGTPPALLFGNFFSWKTKLAALRELGNKTQSPEGETLGDFFRRRFSPELVDYALGPFVAGIYAGHPDNLLVSETFPVLLDYERTYGSVLRGLLKNQTKTARRQSFSFQNGMQTLPDSLARHLTYLHPNAPVERIERVGAGWRVYVPTGPQVVDRLILAVDTQAAARLLDGHFSQLAEALRQVEYPPMTAVHTVYKRADVAHPLNGFGGLNPAAEGRFSAGHIWSSSVFPHRCPPDEVLLTTFVGGTQHAHNAHLPDAEIRARVHQELTESFGIQANTPVRQDVFRWPRAIPQYNARLLAVKNHVPVLRTHNLHLCANWYGGVSLADCIRKGREIVNECMKTVR